MYQPIDYSPLDLPMISQTMFYTQRIWSASPELARRTTSSPSSTGVSVSARFYPLEPEVAESILFFHGNGEVACQYDTLVPSYHRAGDELLRS